MNPSRRMAHWARTLSISLLFCALYDSTAQTETFDDSNDDGWTRFSPLDIVGASSIVSFPDDSAGGKAYRLQSPAPPVPDAGPGRTFTFREESLSDFYAAVDIIDWNNDVDQAFGILFRATSIGLGQTLGYVFNYDPQQASGARGQIQFNIVTGEAAAGTIGAANLSLEPGRNYRFVMEAVGTEFTAHIYDLKNLTAPIVSFTATDDSYGEGAAGLFNFYRGDEVTDSDLGIADTTFDNFITSPNNNRIPFPGGWRGIEGWPHVLNLEPLNRTAFHPADDGIQFAITTLDDQSIDQGRVKLRLNGRDVTGSLTITQGDNGLQISSNALQPNTVYDAQIEIPNIEGPAAITEWTFDTFSDAFLNSEEVEIIELEDYNFDGGKYVDNPPVSGFRENGSGVNANDGYVDREGEPEVDFFDYSSSPAGEDKAIYRSFDPVATQAGASETGSAEEFSGPDPAINDTIRSQYSSVDLTEIQITNTEGGEWLNYTREFKAGDYQVFLRGAGRATQEIHLDEVTSNPAEPDQTTTRLGTFTLPNMGMEYNYRFVPLLNNSGIPARLTLSGTKTIRITIGDQQVDRVDETTALNYLAFVPAVEEPSTPLIVTTSSQISGPFANDPNVQLGDKQITLPISSDQRFLNISSQSRAPVSILKIEVINGSLVIDYSL